MKFFVSLFFLIAAAVSLSAVEPLFFVQLTDTHFGTEESFSRGYAAVDAINALPFKISFVAVTGDIVQKGMAGEDCVERVQSLFEMLEAPVHYVPGNHDILKSAPDETADAFVRRFGPLLSSAEYGGIPFVFICSEPLSGGLQIKGYDSLSELDALLTDRPAVVFHHVPAVDDFYRNRMHDGWNRSPEGLRWSEMLNRHHVMAVVAGHFHRDEMHWLGAVPVYVGPPLSGKFGRQASFRVYQIQDGRLSYRTQYLD